MAFISSLREMTLSSSLTMTAQSCSAKVAYNLFSLS
jgi:hypothetical protein